MLDLIKDHLEDFVVAAFIAHVEQDGHSVFGVPEIHILVALHIFVLSGFKDAFVFLIVVVEHLVWVKEDLFEGEGSGVVWFLKWNDHGVAVHHQVVSRFHSCYEHRSELLNGVFNLLGFLNEDFFVLAMEREVLASAVSACGVGFSSQISYKQELLFWLSCLHLFEQFGERLRGKSWDFTSLIFLASSSFHIFLI